MTRQNHAAILKDLLRGREVFVYARELGPRYPILTGITSCAQFIDPCRILNSVKYLNGRIGIESSLRKVIATGHFQALCTVLAKESPPRLTGLPWPHSTLQHLASGNRTTAKTDLLNRFERNGQIMGVTSWLDAANYWAHVFHNRKMTRHCLGNLQTALLDPSLNFITGPDLIQTWFGLLDSPDEALPFVYESLRSLQLFGDRGNATGAAWARWASIFNKHFRDDDWGHYCLKQARLCSHNKIHLATLDAVLFEARPNTKRLIKGIASSNPVELLELGYFHQIINHHSAEAGQCLEQAANVATCSEHNIRIAESWLVLLNDRKKAHEVLSQAEKMARQEGSTVHYACARLDLLGDRHTAEIALLDAVISGKHPYDLMNLASLYLDHLGDVHSCRTLLQRAEDLMETWREPFRYLCRCATEWIELLGDNQAARRCLSKAIQLANSPDQSILCATTAIRLFNDINKAKQIMSHPIRRASRGRLGEAGRTAGIVPASPFGLKSKLSTSNHPI
ncbi:MAG: hypothetical protein WCO77_04285 [bacterium]